MKRFIFLSFLFMAWSFYELSDGADFIPASARLAPQSETPEDDSKEKIAVRAATSPQTTASIVSTSSLKNTPSAPSIVSATQVEPEPETTSSSANMTETTIEPTEESEVVLSLASLEDAPELFLRKPVKDIRSVQGFQANMRAGPGTDFRILDQLTGGTEVEVLEDTGDGWIKIQHLNDETIGWVSAALLSPQQ